MSNGSEMAEKGLKSSRLQGGEPKISLAAHMSKKGKETKKKR